ncbi:MAG: putative glutaminase [Ilumatobacteraceae bacterium]|nr:putative glutaminase [Ilumatobacteraceae bacterium]
MDGRTSPIAEHLNAVYERYRNTLHGHVATYIPELARVDPDRFGIAMAIVDGHVYEVGDSRHEFTIQSVSKAFTFGLALRDHGRDSLLSRVGVEPTGDPFNAIVLDEVANRPPNPMVNAGAIAVTGLIDGDDAAHRWDRIIGALSSFAGRPLSVDDSVASSEADTGHRNRAMAHLMRGFDMLRPDVEEVLDLYFRQCAVNVNAVDLALMGATLANGGRQPVTGEQVLSASETGSVLSVMSSCGMYDASGEWLYRVGLPSKSGVGGGIVAVLPGQAAIAVFSPRLDARGNSVRGHLVCEDLSNELGMHLFDERRATIALRSTYGRDTVSSRHVRLAEHQQMLTDRGDEIMVVELQGNLGFGSLERLCRHVIGRSDAANELLLDMRRVTGIEPVAARLLADLVRRSTDEGMSVMFSSVPVTGPVRDRIDGAFADEGVPVPALFDDLDRALDHAEGSLLIRHQAMGESNTVDLADVVVCRGLDADDLAALQGVLAPITFTAGQVAGRPGEAAFSAWLILGGTLTIAIDGDDSLPGRRLRTVGPGSILGEMALLSGTVRSAWVWAQSDVSALVLTPEGLDTFAISRPTGAVTLLRNIGAVIGGWLRDADRVPNDELVNR